MGNPRCSWVRDRLPLLTGDDLVVSDRRRVERHLIGCTKCRECQAALENALQVLHVASAQAPARLDAPSLWPELARQIRQSHRPVSAPAFVWPRFGLRPALALGLLAVIGITLATRPPRTVVKVAAVSNVPPVAAPIAPVEAPAPATGAVAETNRESSKPPVTETTASEPAPPTRLGFDLDHGTPMGSELREGKQPTY
jgi:anti-sigma factor RsiW